MENSEFRTLTEGFHRLQRAERLNRLKTLCGLSDDECALLANEKLPSPQIAENLIENVIGYFPIPMGIATHFNIDGRDLVVPMAVEETSIIAAASATAKWVRSHGVITTYAKGKLIIGQIQIPSVHDSARVREILHLNRLRIIERANEFLPSLVARGGGVRDIAIRELDRNYTSEGLIPRSDRTNIRDLSNDGKMLVIHILCDPCDAMGANLINQVCEAIKPLIEELTEERVGLCILSNLVDTKLAGAEIHIRNIDKKVGRGIEEASRFAKVDPYRAATHNKGVLNGIDPILIATGNDWRAVEAGIHAYAARSGSYQPVTDWQMQGNDLVGRIEIPVAVGTVGGVTRIHPIAKISLKIMGVEHAEELARICAAVGLVQNLGALKALATVGIVKGHMQLHAANLALAAGAEVHEIAQVRAKLTEVLKTERNISLTRAREILEEIRANSGY